MKFKGNSNVVEVVLGHFGHGHFGHERFGSDISAMEFRPRKMSEVDVSAITINFGFCM